MTTKTIENIWATIFIMITIFLISVIIYLICGIIKQPKDVLVKQDTEYLYYKQYTIYGKDSTINKFHKPIEYTGTITRKSNHFVGVVGKGGHMVYKTVIQYNTSEEYVENGGWYYNHHNEGDKVQVRVEYYPYYHIEILN